MNKLTVLGVCGSPRKGNSQYLLEKSLQAAKNVAPDKIICESYTLRGKKIGPCISCDRCFKTNGECIIKDSFQELRDLWFKADVIIYSVPVYHMGIPGQLKCFIDRLGNSIMGQFLNYFNSGEEDMPKFLKVIGSMTNGIHMCSGQEHTQTQLINHALVCRCIPVPGDTWKSYLGSAGWTSNKFEKNALQYQFEQGEFDANVIVESAESVGKRCAEMALIIREGMINCKDYLMDNAYYTPYYKKMN